MAEQHTAIGRGYVIVGGQWTSGWKFFCYLTNEITVQGGAYKVS